MAIKWITLLCLVISISVAQAQDSMIATDQISNVPAAVVVPSIPANQSQGSAAINPGGPQGEGPIADIVFTGGECMQKCTRILGDLNEVADPKNIEKVIRDLDSLCEKYQNAIQCVTSCTAEEKANFNRSTALLQFTCIDKRAMLQQLGPCMTQHQDSSSTTCEQQCGSLDDLIKVDNSSTPTDPQQIFAKMGPVCNGLKCTIKCMKNDMNQKCPGAGDFIRDIAVKQIEEAGNQLTKDVTDPQNPLAEHLAQVLKDTLPADCAYMLAPQQFRDAVDAGSNSTENVPQQPSVQIDQAIGRPEPEPAASAEPPSSASHDVAEDNRTIKKEPMDPVKASGNLVASALAICCAVLFAYL